MHPFSSARPRTRRPLARRLFVAISAATLMLATPTALADNLVADGDELVGANATLGLGEICIGESATGSVILVLDRAGNTGPQVWGNGVSVTISAPTQSTARGSASAGSLSATTLSNWVTGSASADAAKLVNAGSSTVTVTVPTTATVGVGAATLTFSGTGAGYDTPSVTRLDTVAVSWNVVDCTPSNSKPSVVVTGVTDGASYEIGTLLSPGCSVTDAEDGPSTFAAMVTGTLSHGLGNLTATCDYTDEGGLAADTASATYAIVDTGDPTISHTLTPAAPNANGWFKTDVAVDFTCDDSGSGIASCEGDTTLVEGENQSVTGTATDWAGNTATDTVSDIDIDKTAPEVSLVGGPADGASYYFGFLPAAPTCSSSDALSGIDGSCTVSGGGSTVGTHSYTANVTDQAGNTASDTVSYTVLAWTLKGFYAPVDMGGVLNTVKGGSTVPLKFEVFAGPTELTDVAVVRSLTAQKITCAGAALEDSIEVTSTGGTSLRYDMTGGQFIQNWKTPTGAGTCYRTTVETQDGSSISALFKIK